MSRFIFLGFFFLTNALYAKMLSFHPGDQASYTILQKIDINEKDDIDGAHVEVQLELSLDVNILSTALRGTYPMEVELIVRKALISKTGDETETFSKKRLSQHFEKLVDQPLLFRIDASSQARETTGYLQKICNTYHDSVYNDSSDSISDSTSEFFSDSVYNSQNNLSDFEDDDDCFSEDPVLFYFEQFVSQLFHLSGQTLFLNQTYPYQEDEDDSDVSYTIFPEYTIYEIDEETIKATWEGESQTIYVDEDSSLDVPNEEKEIYSTSGFVSWKRGFSLFQEREVYYHITSEETFPYYNLQVHIQQFWHPQVLP